MSAYKEPRESKWKSWLRLKKKKVYPNFPFRLEIRILSCSCVVKLKISNVSLCAQWHLYHLARVQEAQGQTPPLSIHIASTSTSLNSSKAMELVAVTLPSFPWWRWSALGKRPSTCRTLTQWLSHRLGSHIVKTIYSGANVCIIKLLKFFIKEVEINTEHRS